ncbi:magnesium transporter [Parendozoicomonas haliclonae]|uniref:Magnesium transporter MgtE n=1 Tax=Parendozoicomonas haliclonae TaxID=1960125 RepID=A0A1X7AFX4_9GAMM|nr:magnesium transporter [Parendozoicomonas haliclonae]SMA37313.1 Magnesium transporter MgtE [Parendozoicomonas haliclonae]
MPQQQSLALSDDQLEAINRAIEKNMPEYIQHMLTSLSAADIAHLLESSPPRQRSLIWKLVPIEDEGDVLNELGEEVRQFFTDQMNVAELISILEDQDIDDTVDILQNLPQKITRQVLDSMSQQNRHRVEEVLAYPENTAGGLMNTDTLTVRGDITVDVALRYIRLHESLPEPFDQLLIVDRKDHLSGTVSIRRLLTSPTSSLLSELMEETVHSIPVTMEDSQIAQIFEREDLISAPVIDEQGHLLGRITVDDVVDVIREEAEHSVMSMAGLAEDEDTFAPAWKTSRRRAVWLGVNLCTAFISASVIGLFQETIDRVVALAVLMPIVASMGGVAGSQTLTLIIRAIALGQIGKSNISWLLSREFLVGLFNGLLWATVVALAAMYWFDDTVIAVVIALALVINLIVAVLAGAMLPIALKALKIDPALAGSVALTTITDVVGFLSFLGLATLFYG